MIRFRTKGDYKKAKRYLEKLHKNPIEKVLEKYGEAGVAALSSATPVDTGLTASSWGYRIKTTSAFSEIVFTNSHIVKDVNIAIILQYGHGTSTGGYVQGRDYINPAIQPVFDQIVEQAWGEVTKL